MNYLSQTVLRDLPRSLRQASYQRCDVPSNIDSTSLLTDGYVTTLLLGSHRSGVGGDTAAGLVRVGRPVRSSNPNFESHVSILNSMGTVAQPSIGVAPRFEGLKSQLRTVSWA